MTLAETLDGSEYSYRESGKKSKFVHARDKASAGD